MPKVNGLSDQAVAQLMELFRREQMRLIPPPIPTQRRRRIYAANEGVPFINESGETVPPYAVMEVVSVDANGVAHIVKPTVNRGNPYLVNRGVEVFDNYQGVGDYGYDKPVKMLIGSSDSSYTANHTYFLAPPVDSWVAKSNTSDGVTYGNEESFGFKLCGTTNEDTDVEGAVVHWGTQAKENMIQSASVDMTAMKAYASSTTIDEIGNAISDEYGFLYTSQSFESYRLGWKTTNSSNPYSNGLIECIRDGFYRVEFIYNFAVRFHLWYEDTEYAEERTTSTESSHSHTYQIPRAYWFGNHTLFIAGINEFQNNANFHITSPRAEPIGGYQTDSLDLSFTDETSADEYTYYNGIVTFDSQFGIGDKLTPFFRASPNVKLTGELAALLRLTQASPTESQDWTTLLRVTRLRNAEKSN